MIFRSLDRIRILLDCKHIAGEDSKVKWGVLGGGFSEVEN
jgi:hypothetical protein